MPFIRSSDRLAHAVREVLRGAAKRRTSLTTLALALHCAAVPITVEAAELPTVCVAGSCGSDDSGVIRFVTRGVASAVTSGNILNVNQTSNSAVLNWSSFNISADGTVNFNQPSASATAINRIHQNDPSRIFGVLNANGRVYLINRNGVLFGDGAKVNVAGLVASSLAITQKAIDNGIAGAAAVEQSPAFTSYFEGGVPLPSGDVRVERGANITTPEGGQVLMFAPKIVNEGTIKTPGGQTLLAAGSPVYLTTSSDPNLRGLLVEVGVGGIVTNGNAQANGAVQDPAQLVGQIVAERGNVTLAGLAVNQDGRVSASTSVRTNGSVRLQGRDGGSTAGNPPLLNSSRGGELTLGTNSVTEVVLDTADPMTQVDVNEQPRSTVTMDAGEVRLGESSRVTATGGDILISAQRHPDGAASGRIHVGEGAILDSSGADVTLPMERNVVRVELRGSQLADSPAQRDGVLRGEAVFVDVRQSGTRADGTTWQGTPLADVSGDIAAVGRAVGERNLRGGTVSFETFGSVLVESGALVDISGGSITYQDGNIDTTQLLSNGRVYDIGVADPNRTYQGIVDSYTLEHPRWGVVETFPGYPSDPHGRFEPGYVEGKDAGQVSIRAAQVVLDGSIDGSVTRGPHQRLPSGTLATGQVYRPYDQLPLRGQLIVGDIADNLDVPSPRPNNVRIESGLVLPSLTNEDGSPFDPANDPLVEALSEFRLRPELLGDDGVGRVMIFANGRITVPDTTQISMPVGGEFALTGGMLNINGAIDVPAGQISLTARAVPPLTPATPIEEASLELGSQARLTAMGRWVNDSPQAMPDGAPTLPLLIDGGRVSLSVRQGDATLAPGSVIDVSGGAHLDADGDLHAGRGGSVSISTSPVTSLTGGVSPVELTLGSDIRGHSLAAGGALSITANAVCISMLDCSMDDATTLWLSPQLFEESGFSSYRVASNRDGITLEAGTHVHLQQVNLELLGDLSQRPSADSVLSFAQRTVLANFERSPVDLTLAAAVTRGGDTRFTNATFDLAPGLHLGTGSVIQGDPGASVALRSNTRVLLDGSVLAPAGEIDVELMTDLLVDEFIDAQAIWLGDSARLDARGIALVRSDDLGRRVGEVRGGGSVSITATRGYVVALPGSVIDVSGTAAELDLPADPSRVATVPTTIASNGGEISLTAAEGLLLSGELLGLPGDGAGASGGELSVAIDPSNRSAILSLTNFSLFPLAPRTLVLTQSAAPVVIAPGTPVPRNLNGLAFVDAEMVDHGQFDSLALTAREIERRFGGTPTFDLGRIRFEGDSTFELGRRILLDAAVIEGASGKFELNAPYIAFGSTTRNTQALPADLISGEGELRLAADFIDVIGNSALQGIAQTRLVSTGDLRLRGVQSAEGAVYSRELQGSLVTTGDLEMIADQIYPATLSQFEIRSEGVTGTIRVGARGAPAPILTAGGALTLRAPRIEQAGVLRAPFGSISLIATDELVLESGSVTSTSGANLLVPFGQTQGGFDWVYELFNQQTLVYGRGPDPLPERRVELDAADIDVRDGAVIDVSGGGDLLAYEFIPGVGGSRDVLANDERPGQFAIVPGLGLEYAPFDQAEFAGSTLQPGDSVYLSGIDGLAAGTYALLPARYALLPGAYLVTIAPGYQDILPGEQYRQLDGSLVVAGRRTIAGTAFTDARFSGFALRPGETVLEEAQYTSTLASTFFADQAEREEIAAPRLPQDAGVLSITAGTRLELQGSLAAAAANGGRGAAVDISGDRLRVSNDSSSAVEGEVLLDPTSLSALGAESLLLGGRRTQSTDGLLITASAEQVSFDAGVALSGAEIMVVATDSILVDSTARLTATSATAPSSDETLLLQGDGALLRVSSGAQATLQRTDAVGTSGTLELREGAVLQAAQGSIILDATRDTRSQAAIEAPGGSLNLGASRISLGDTLEEVEGLTLSNADLAGLGVAELVLTSRSTVDLYGNLAVDLNRLVIEAGALRGRGDAQTSLAVLDTVEFANRNGVVVDADVDVGTASLNISSRETVLGAGNFLIDGFANTRIEATDRILADEVGSTVVTGAMTLATAQLTTTAGAERTISASGSMTISPATASTTSSTTADASTVQPGIGGRLVVQGTSILHDGRIELPAGELRFEANGAETTDGIVLSSRSTIDLRGTSTDFDSVVVAAAGGHLDMQSRNGGVLVASGSVINVSGAAGSGDAGEVSIAAPLGSVDIQGQLLATVADGSRGGVFQVDAGSIVQLDALNAMLNAGEFSAERSFRQRQGDLVVGSDAAAVIRAEDVTLTADQGGISVLGSIDARASAGGRIALNSRGDLSIDGALLASATTAGEDGGRISLASTSAAIHLGSQSVLDVSAGSSVDGAEAPQPGEIQLSLLRTSLASLLDADPLNDALSIAGRVSGAGVVQIEGHQVYQSLSGEISFSEVATFGNPWFDEAQAFMDTAPQILQALGLENDAAVKIVPGVEIVSETTLTLREDWNLYDWRFNDSPGVLTLRAGGSLVFEHSLSDGFATVFDFILPEQPSDSWSYRLVAGADTASADTFAVRALNELAADEGDLRIESGSFPGDQYIPADFRMIRTGTGDIDIRAARDLRLGTPDTGILAQTAVIYTAGVSGPGIRLPGELGGLNMLPYPTDGGAISIETGGSIKGARSTQLVTDWLWRVGSPEGSGVSSPTAWTVNFQRFEQGIGALGGGDVTIRADGDVENLSVSLPVIGRQVGGLQVSDNRVELAGGGDLTLQARGSIRGGSFLVGNGTASIASGASIETGPVDPFFSDPLPLAPLLGLIGPGEYLVSARTNLEIESVFNPTLLPQGLTQNPNLENNSFFSTYDAQSGVSLLSVAGDVMLRNDIDTTTTAFQSIAFGEDTRIAMRLYAPSLRASALSQDVRVLGSMSLYPAPKSNLELFAERDVIARDSIGVPDLVQVLMSDADPQFLPTAAAPHTDMGRVAEVLGSAESASSNLHAPIPVHADERQTDGVPDVTPVRVVARSGSILLEPEQPQDSSGFFLPKPARIVAAEDIQDLRLVTQHLHATDITTVSAGRDIVYGVRRSSAGAVLGSNREIVVDGSGRLELIAGGSVDLQTSGGISTRGNIVVPGLGDEGASISVLTGIGNQAPDLAAFRNAYLRDSSVYDQQLIDFVESATGASGLDKASALALFVTLSESQQRTLIDPVFFAELRASGRAAANAGNSDFSRGFAALEALFPGSNPDLDAGESNAYSGDLSLFFSRIYTLDGGDIDLLVPGGLINVGLATPPAAFGIQKEPAQLGMVAQSTGSISAFAYGDFAVNESRAFAADGGDILVWSTRGDIDAGRGAKTAISAPPPVITSDPETGATVVTFPAALRGSGIQTLATSPGREPGDVDLFAPRGVVNAGDAGIVAGNLTIAATAVLGADNIQVSGVAVGVPVDTGGLGAALSGVSNVASAAANAATTAVDAGNRNQEEKQASLADSALSWLEVFVVGLGEENCKQDDVECLKRQKSTD